MIEISSIRKSFGKNEVLKGISGTFEKGKTNLIIGASGTGKSVLLKIIVGLITPDSGTVRYDGQDFYRLEQKEQRELRRKIGMLFQGSALFDSKTVIENIRFPLDMLTTQTKAEKDKRVAFCLDRVGLSHAGHLMPSEISGGMQKRVGIARAIVLNSEYLFVDEPNSGLDPMTATLIDQLVQEITHEYQTTTVVVTHDMNSVMEIGERVMFLHQGHKVWEGNNQEIAHTKVAELNAFMFSNRLMRSYQQEEKEE
ncbi:MAG: ABC transporter ATP-binding protein [Bernardetiaceae bacterium]